MSEIDSLDELAIPSFINETAFSLEIETASEENDPSISAFVSHLHYALDRLEFSSFSQEIKKCQEFVATKCGNDQNVMKALDKSIKAWIAIQELEDETFPIEKLLTATMFAAEKHEGQTRKNPEKTPYIIHPIGVAQIALELGDIRSGDALIAALLHDTLEDTDATPSEIKTLFGSHTLALVQDLTNSPHLEGNALKIAQIEHAPFMLEEAKVIKLADRYYNVCDLKTVNWEQKKIDGYVNFGAKLAQVLRGTCPTLKQAIDNQVSAHRASLYPSSTFVGKLKDAWQFPSDHLPIGVSVDGIEIVSWNVLNTVYLNWVEERDTQGLKGSLISSSNVVTNELTGLTKRDELVIHNLSNMIHHPTHPKHLLCLQECGPALLMALKDSLPEHMKIVYTASEPFPLDQNIVIYNSRLMEWKSDLSRIDHPFDCQESRSVMNLVFEKENQLYRIINAHLPGDPNLPGRDEFASFVNKQPEDHVIALGDMNFTQENMKKSFLEKDGQNLPFTLLSSYPTNIGLDFRSKVIDHVYVKGSTNWELHDPEKVLEGLSSQVDLLTISREKFFQKIKV